jgi:hypothetical protein
VQSTDFGPIVSPLGAQARRKAKGGAVGHEEPPKPHHGALNLIVVMPHPALPALAHAAMLHHAGMHLGHAIGRHHMMRRGGR